MVEVGRVGKQLCSGRATFDTGVAFDANTGDGGGVGRGDGAHGAEVGADAAASAEVGKGDGLDTSDVDGFVVVGTGVVERVGIRFAGDGDRRVEGGESLVE